VYSGSCSAAYWAPLFLEIQGNNCRSPIKVQDQLYRKVVDNYSEIMEELYARDVKFSSRSPQESEGTYIVLGFRSHGGMNLAALQVIIIYGDAGLKNL
jgi:hypothetical protein